MALMVYQYIGIIIGIIGIIDTFIRFRESKMSPGMLIIWSVIWIILIVLSIFPTATGYFAGLTGIGRGLDVIIILGLIGCYYLIFRIYNMIENIEQEITQLTREMALHRKNIDLKKDEKLK
jgi:hypothetical protein